MPQKKKQNRRHQKKSKTTKKTQKQCAAGDMAPPPAARCRYRLFLRCFFWIFVFSGVSVLFFFWGVFLYCFCFLVARPVSMSPPGGCPVHFIFGYHGNFRCNQRLGLTTYLKYCEK